MKALLRSAIATLSIFLLSGCDSGFQQMGSTEYGIIYRNLPPFLGGGVATKVDEPGALVVVWPWEKIIRIDTAVHGISWGQGNYVATRALDGNEVALAVTVRYQIKPDKAGLVSMVKSAAISNEQVESLVRVAATADIRTYMNELHTSQYLQRDDRYKAVDKAAASLKEKLAPYNIDVLAVNLDDFRFERILDDGGVDASYQDKLNETQRSREETEREKARIETVVAKKQQEFNDVQALVNRQLAEAEGYKVQAKVRGDSYFEARLNEAKALLAVGKAEVEGLTQKVQALSGPGGRALLKLEVAKNLMKNNPKFVVMGSGLQTPAVDVRKTDTNELIKQAGIFEALKDRPVEQQGAQQTMQSGGGAPSKNTQESVRQNDN